LIPVTSFAGKTVAVFGLGGSGLASCHALKAGGAEVIAGDDSTENVAKAAQAGFITADLRNVSWDNFAALVLAALGFGFNSGPYDLILMGFVTIFTLVSVSLYLVEWVRHMSTIETA